MKLNFYLSSFQYSPTHNTPGSEMDVNLHGNRNPFVKIGDRVKLHSRNGSYRVLATENDHFVVADLNHHWFSHTRKDIKCTWDEFKGWSRKVEQ